MDSFAHMYFEETKEHLEQCELCLTDLEQAVDREPVDRLFRYVHSIKGSSDMMGFREIKDLAHELENLLDQARNGQVAVDHTAMDVCFDAVDLMSEMLTNRKANLQGVANTPVIEAAQQLKQTINQLQSPKNSSQLNSVGTRPAEKKSSTSPTPSQNPLRSREQTTSPGQTSTDLPRGTTLTEPGTSDFAEPGTAVSPEQGPLDSTEPETTELSEPKASVQNTYFLTLQLDPQNPMDAVTRYLILNRLDEHGALHYSDPGRTTIEQMESLPDHTLFQALYQTSLDRYDLVQEINVGYVQDLFVMDLGQAYRNHLLTQSDSQFFTDYFLILAGLLTKTRSLQEQFDEKEWRRLHYTLVQISSRMVLLPENRQYLEWRDSPQLMMNAFELFPTEHLHHLPAKTLVLFEDLMLHALYSAYSLIRNEAVIKTIQVDHQQNITLLLQNIVQELNPARFQFLVVEISEKQVIRSNERHTLQRVRKELDEKGIAMRLAHNGAQPLRFYHGTEYLELDQWLILYQNERDLLKKILTCMDQERGLLHANSND